MVTELNERGWLHYEGGASVATLPPTQPAPLAEFSLDELFRLCCVSIEKSILFVCSHDPLVYTAALTVRAEVTFESSCCPLHKQ